MSVEELIAKLQTYPPHFRVEAARIDHSGETEDRVADIVDVVNYNYVNHKIVSIDLAGELEEA